MSLYKKTDSNIFDRVRKVGLPAGEYAVFGSALMDVWGLRKSADLNIVVTPKLYNQLKKDGWEEKQHKGFKALLKGDAEVTTAQNQTDDGYDHDVMRLIKDAVFIDGLPFVKIEEVIACKTAYDRPKDREDLVKIKEYIKKQS